MLGALLIALREGLEAVLIVSILYAYVKKVEREDVLPKLWLGIAVGTVIPMSVGAYLFGAPTPSRLKRRRPSGDSCPCLRSPS